MTGTRRRIEKFLELSQMNKTKFCQAVKLSQSMLYYYMTGERDLSDDSEQRVNTFIDRYIAALNEV